MNGPLLPSIDIATTHSAVAKTTDSGSQTADSGFADSFKEAQKEQSVAVKSAKGDPSSQETTDTASGANASTTTATKAASTEDANAKGEDAREEAIKETHGAGHTVSASDDTETAALNNEGSAWEQLKSKVAEALQQLTSQGDDVNSPVETIDLSILADAFTEKLQGGSVAIDADAIMQQLEATLTPEQLESWLQSVELNNTEGSLDALAASIQAALAGVASVAVGEGKGKLTTDLSGTMTPGAMDTALNTKADSGSSAVSKAATGPTTSAEQLLNHPRESSATSVNTLAGATIAPRNANLFEATLLNANQAQAVAAQSDPKTLSTELLTAGSAVSTLPNSTPAGKAQLLVSTPFQQAQWGQQVAEKVVWMTNHQIQEAEIHMDPPELGPLQVRVSVTNDQAQVNFVVQHSSVREALDQSAMRLRELFEGEGLNLVDVDVSDQSQQQAAQDDSNNNSASGSGMQADDGTVVTETRLAESGDGYSLISTYA